MRHFTRFATYIEDEEGNQPEFEIGVEVEVCSEDDVTLNKIEEVYVTDPDDGPWVTGVNIPVKLLPEGAIQTIEFDIEERKYDIYDEARDTSYDDYCDAKFEQMREERYEDF